MLEAVFSSNCGQVYSPDSAASRSSKHSRFGMPVVAGMWARDVISTKCCTVFMSGATFSISGRKVASKHSTLSPASLAIQTICSGKSRGLMVWHTRPEPDVP